MRRRPRLSSTMKAEHRLTTGVWTRPACCSRVGLKCITKGLFADVIAVRPTAAAERYRGCVAMRCRLASTLTTYWRVCPPSGSSWRRHAGTFCSPQVRRRGLQSTRRTATSMPAPAAGAANGLSVLCRASRPQPRPPMHWKRPCAQIWSICSPVSCLVSLAGWWIIHQHAAETWSTDAV